MNYRLAFLTSATLAIGLFSSAAHSISVPTNDVPENPYPDLKLTGVQLILKTPGETKCPTTAKMNAQIFTNRPGPVLYHIVRKGGSFDGPYSAEAKKSENGIHLAVFSREIPVSASADFQYKIIATANNTSAQSKWVRLTANCS